MLFRLLGKLAWGTAKFGVKHIVVPIAISVAVAAVLQRLTEKVRETPNGTATPRRAAFDVPMTP